MADIELVIKIPEHYYENNIKKELPIYLSEDNIVAILPKGHGRLIDADAFSGDMFCDADLTNQHTCYDSICKLLDDAQTIIEAEGSDNV